jgi:hypothetical protein
VSRLLLIWHPGAVGQPLVRAGEADPVAVGPGMAQPALPRRRLQYGASARAQLLLQVWATQKLAHRGDQLVAREDVTVEDLTSPPPAPPSRSGSHQRPFCQLPFSHERAAPSL